MHNGIDPTYLPNKGRYRVDPKAVAITLGSCTCAHLIRW